MPARAQLLQSFGWAHAWLPPAARGMDLRRTDGKLGCSLISVLTSVMLTHTVRADVGPACRQGTLVQPPRPLRTIVMTIVPAAGGASLSARHNAVHSGPHL